MLIDGLARQKKGSLLVDPGGPRACSQPVLDVVIVIMMIPIEPPAVKHALDRRLGLDRAGEQMVEVDVDAQRVFTDAWYTRPSKKICVNVGNVIRMGKVEFFCASFLQL